MGKILALDIGEVRIGVAISDLTQSIAQPFDVINRKPLNTFFEKLQNLIVENDVEKIVIGLPIRTDGSKGLEAEKIINFCDQLKETISVPIEMYDERFSTKIAEDSLIKGGMRREKRKKIRDKIAATIILQNYLDSISNK